MDIYVVRHAVAHKRDEGLWPDDAKRSLTPEGEERFRRAGTDRLARARSLQGTGARLSATKVLSVLARHEDLDSVVIVGHRPGLHELISYLLTGTTIGEECGARVQIKKGGVARLSFDGIPEPGVGSLEWVLTPKALRVAGKRRRPVADG